MYANKRPLLGIGPRGTSVTMCMNKVQLQSPVTGNSATDNTKSPKRKRTY